MKNEYGHLFSHFKLPCLSSHPCLSTLSYMSSDIRLVINVQHRVPQMFLCNPRSLVNKIDEFQATLSQNQVDIAVVSETWLSDNHPESAITVSGYNLFSKHRRDRRGGGVAVYVDQTISSRQLSECPVPDELECVWVMTRPRRLPRPLSCIVVCGVYLPPDSPHRDTFAGHVLAVTDNMRTKYPDCGFAILGDFNRTDVSDICRGGLLSQVVKDNT